MALDIGDTVVIPGSNQTLTILGVYRDYSSDRGVLTISANTHQLLFNHLPWTAAALYLDSDVEVNGVMQQIRQLSYAPTKLFVRSNRGLREASFEVFDQTFRITGVLKWLSLMVAVVGMISVLMVMQLARTKEYALLGATGFSKCQLVKQMLSEFGLMGVFTGILAVPIGLVLAVLLIEVINVRSFGWSISVVINWWLALEAILYAFIAALLASAYPIYQFLRQSIVEGLQSSS